MGSVIAARAGLVGDPGTYTFRTVDPAAITGVGQLYWKNVAPGENELFVRDEDSGIDIVQITDGNGLNAAAVDHGGLGGLADDDHAQYALVAGRAAEDLTVQGGLVVATAGPDAAKQHTLPDVASDTVALLAATQTLAAKTLTTPDVNGGTVDSLTALSIRSTGAAYDLTFATATVFTAGRTLTIDPGDAARTVTLSGNPTLDDWFNQDVKSTANPTFVNLTITSFAANWTNAGRTVADLGIVTTADINGGTIDGVTIGGASAGAITATTITAGGVLQMSGNAVVGHTAAGGDLYLRATSSATDGDVIFQSDPTTERGRFASTGEFLVGAASGAGGTPSELLYFLRSQNAPTYGRLDNLATGTAATSYFSCRTNVGAAVGISITAYSTAHSDTTRAGFGALTNVGASSEGIMIDCLSPKPIIFNTNAQKEMELLSGGGLNPGTNDRGSLGAPGTAWSDLALASGAVIDLGNGNYTATHSAGLLTLSGDLSLANLTITSFAANWTNAGRTVADLGIVTTADINGGTIDGVTIGGASAGAITGTTITATGDLLFSGEGSGLLFGEIYVKDNAGATVLNSAAKVQVTSFAVDGESNGMTPDHTNDHVTVDTAGKYLCTVSIHVNNNAVQTHTVDVSVWKNNGAAEFLNCHSHRTLTGGSGDVGSMSISGIIDLAATDTIEVWADTSDAADRSVTFEDITLSLVKLGGT